MLWCLCALRGRARRRQWCDSLDYVTVYGAGACLYSPLTLTVSTDLGSRTTDSTALPMLWTPSNHNRNHFQFHKGKPEVVTVMSLQPVESGKRLCSLRSDAEAGIGLAEPLRICCIWQWVQATPYTATRSRQPHLSHLPVRSMTYSGSNSPREFGNCCFNWLTIQSFQKQPMQ